ncbi:hypothetical protein D3C74_358220 [compost metagenome]
MDSFRCEWENNAMLQDRRYWRKRDDSHQNGSIYVRDRTHDPAACASGNMADLRWTRKACGQTGHSGLGRYEVDEPIRHSTGWRVGVLSGTVALPTADS